MMGKKLWEYEIKSNYLVHCYVKWFEILSVLFHVGMGPVLNTEQDMKLK